MKITWLTLALLAVVAVITVYSACGETITEGATCAETESCIQQCADSDCIPTCLSLLSPTATSYYNALESCTTPACATPTDGGVTVPPCATTGDPDCAICIMAHCSAELAACNAH